MSEKYQSKPTGSGGMAGSTTTPANAGVGADKPGMFDKEGAIGKQFTGEFLLPIKPVTKLSLPLTSLSI